MARFPIARTSRGLTPNVGSSPVRLDFNTGQGDIASAMVRLGGVMADEADRWNRLNADTEFSEYKRRGSERIVDLSKRIGKTDEQGNLVYDPSQYEDMYEETLDEIKADRPNNKLAGRYYDLWMNQQTPAWHQGIVSEIQQGIAHKARAGLAQQKAQNEANLDVFLLDMEDRAIQEAGGDESAGKLAVLKYLESSKGQREILNTFKIGIDDVSIKAGHIHERYQASRVRREQAAKEEKDAYTNGLYGSALTGQLSPEMMPSIDKALAEGKIDAADHERVIRWMTSDKRTTKEQRNFAFGTINQALVDMGNGDKTPEEASKIVYQYIFDVDEVRGREFIERIQNGPKPRPKTEADMLYVDAISNAKPMFDSWFPGSVGTDKDETDVADRIVAEGDFEQRLSDWSKANFPDGVVRDRNKFMAGATNIILKMKQERTVVKGPGPLSRVGDWLNEPLDKPPDGYQGAWGTMPPKATETGSNTERVTMVDPDGRTYTVTANEVDEAVKHGWRRK